MFVHSEPCLKCIKRDLPCPLFLKLFLFVSLILFIPFVVIVQSLSHVRLFATPGTAACQASLSFTTSWSLLKLISIEYVMPPSHLILCHPLLLLPSVFPSNESALHIRWPKYWSFSFSISPSNEYSGLISFGIHWFDLLAVQGILKSLLQHYSSKAKNEFCNLLSVCFYQLYYIYISGLLDALILRHLPRRGQFIMNDISIVMSCEDRIPKGTLLDSEYLSLKDLP